MKILVIEDDDEAAAYLVKGLSESGHQVDLAISGRSGLERAEKGEFDALVIDRMLPELDGLSIVSELRAHQNETPVLIVSALGDVDNRVEGLRAGCDDFGAVRCSDASRPREDLSPIFPSASAASTCSGPSTLATSVIGASAYAAL